MRVEHVAVRLGDEGLEGVRHEGEPDARHLRDEARPSGGGVHHAAGRDRATIGDDAAARTVDDVDAGHLGVLVDVDAAPRRGRCVPPHDRVVPRRRPRGVERGPQHRQLPAAREVHVGIHPMDSHRA